MAPAIPQVERSDHAHAFGIRCPDGELHARDAIDRARMGAQEAMRAPMRTLAECAQLALVDEWREGVSVVHFVETTRAVLPGNRVAGRHAPRGSLPDEEITAAVTGRIVGPVDAHVRGARQVRDDDFPAGMLVPAQDRVRVVVAGVAQSLEVAFQARKQLAHFALACCRHRLQR